MNTYNIENAVVELLENCNLKCKHCYGFFNKNNTININDYTNLIKELYKLGCSQLILSGGEPTLLGNKLFQYVDITRSVGINKIILTTNGTIAFKDYKNFTKFDLIQVSIDGKETTHDKIRGIGNYKKAISFIENLKKNNCNISVMMTVHKENYNDLDFLYNFFKNKKILFGIEIATSCGRGNDIESISKDQYYILKNYIQDNNISCNDPIAFVENNCFFPYFSKDTLGGCSAGVSSVCISSQLEIFPCPRLRLSCGSLTHDNLSSIWSYSKIFNQLRDRDSFTGNCSKCVHLYRCGGCRARAYIKNKSIISGDNFCFINDH